MAVGVSADLHLRLRDLALHEMAADPAHDIAHLDRVWANVQRIRNAEGSGDWRVLCAAAYLHDLVNRPKDDPDRYMASFESSSRAEDLVLAIGYTPQEAEDVRSAVYTHSYSVGIEPAKPEGRILRDADRLDALGAIGLARVFAVSGGLGRPLYDPEDPFAEGRPVDDRQWALDHFKAKLLRLEQGMLTDEGRRMAAERTRYMRDFLARLGTEI